MPRKSLIPGGNIGAVAALVWALAAVPSFAQGVDEAFSYSGLFIADWTRNIGGGANPDSSAGRYWLDLHFEADLEQLLELPATTLGMDLWHIAGDNGSIDVGSLQETSYLDAEPDSLLAQAWLRHEALDGQLAMQVGRIDANEHFYSTDVGANFHNAAAALPVTMMGIVSYPDPTEGGLLHYQYSDRSYAQVGVFDLDDPALLAEIGHAPTETSRFSAGAWYYTADFTCFDGSHCGGAVGYYLCGEGTLFPQQQIDALARVSFADDQISPFGHHTALGIVWRAPFAAREDDEIGVLHLHGDLSNAPGSPFQAGAEQIVESYYRISLNDHVAIQPCLQFVSNPGGQYDDTWVPCIRIEVTF